MARLLQLPELDWKPDGTPVARAADDIYFTAGGGLAEARAVFLGGCDLPAAWTGRRRFTVAETGFGTGLNFLALWSLWRSARPSPDAYLHFVSFEGFPLCREDAARALAAFPELQDLAAHVLRIWPAPVRGVRRHVWAAEGISLDLHLGDIAETLPRSSFTADAWFLDGFGPAKNPAMWTEDVLRQITARAAPGARAASFTVAGDVRRGLAAAGFDVVKKSGYGRKRERLEAVMPGAPMPERAAVRVAVIGAGIGGACAARALVDFGAEVTVFERAGAAATGASGNPRALVMPRLDAGDTPAARLMIDAYLAARAFYAGRAGVAEGGVVHRPKNETERARFEKLCADPPLPLEDLEAMPGGLLHKRALLITPQPLIGELLAGVDVRYGAAPDIDLATRCVGGEVFGAIVLANGIDIARLLPWLGLTPRLGQVDYVTGGAPHPPDAVADGAYALCDGDTRLWGATFEAGDEPLVSDVARAKNMQDLKRLDPWWMGDVQGTEVFSRAGIRATTADRLPLIGAVPDEARCQEVFAGLKNGRLIEADVPRLAGIYIATGFGARGFTFAPWAAGLIASAIRGAPMPAATDVAATANPPRALRRAMKRA
jgi:tRNA 5-methylaminomethyl-2-thiouridine biosynthesis bifunctional protein